MFQKQREQEAKEMKKLRGDAKRRRQQVCGAYGQGIGDKGKGKRRGGMGGEITQHNTMQLAQRNTIHTT